jgi:glycerophosphoryl diester phosphodiesterase
MSDFNKIVFGKKTFSNLLEEIYDNQKKKSRQISALIAELKPLVQEISDATLIVPLIKEYLEIDVKNDEQLVKIATIIQRTMSNISESGDSLGISEEERAQLMAEIEKIQEGK